MSNREFLPVRSDVVFRLFFADERNVESLIGFLKSVLKLPEDADGTELYDWAKFIAADTEEELNMIAERNPQVAQAVVRLRELSADERARDLYERREKARRDQSSRERWAAKLQAIEIAKNALRKKMTVDDIMDITGLTREEVENLNNAN
ncbi:MAG: Rpn family recombination-promoting nuclease/putative transposase [Clostridiales bacterium]|nr:Rpn family recombination-promoting nuclease/putative transposase [Clostridiales bacterium]